VKIQTVRVVSRALMFAGTFLLLISVSPLPAEGWKGKPFGYEVTDWLTMELPGYYRFRFTHQGPMLLSEIPIGQRAGEQETVGEIDYTEHRLRFKPKITLFQKLSFNSQLDVLSGMLSGDTTGREFMWFAQPEQRWNDVNGAKTSDFLDVHFTRFWGNWDSPIGVIRVGRQGSSWGLGLLANDGDDFRNDFGDAYYGDTVDRVLFGTKPYSLLKRLVTGEKPEKDPLTLAFAYDWNVFRDSQIKRAGDKKALRNASDKIVLYGDPVDDEANQYVGAIRVETGVFEGGFYIVRRDTEHFDVLVPASNRPPREFLKAWVFDVYGKLNLKPSFFKDGEIFLEGEVARITGETNFTVSRILQQPGNPFPVSNVSQLGWVVRAGARNAWIDARIESGYASGDSNPFDDEVRNFKFHPDYNVGMILFEDLLAGVSNASAYNATLVFDEGGPVRTLGADLLPSSGSVTNAVFVNPVVKIRPAKNWETVLGVLWARTATDFVDPSIDFLYGGGWGQYNPLGAPSGHHELGWEIDCGMKYTWERPYWDLTLGAQYGHFFPGNVFEDADGNRMDDIDKVQARFTLIW